ncbi:hypothetical protein VTK73DRAFT_5485 [Phialemonium thermophilum]|uniref:Uncharacterized protein n=1 Tax=Phialemonium thermophilum TaxID=223376 RepID=A0ABR3V1H9_9PEZI
MEPLPRVLSYHVTPDLIQASHMLAWRFFSLPFGKGSFCFVVRKTVAGLLIRRGTVQLSDLLLFPEVDYRSSALVSLRQGHWACFYREEPELQDVVV